MEREERETERIKKKKNKKKESYLIYSRIINRVLLIKLIIAHHNDNFKNFLSKDMKYQKYITN